MYACCRLANFTLLALHLHRLDTTYNNNTYMYTYMYIHTIHLVHQGLRTSMLSFYKYIIKMDKHIREVGVCRDSMFPSVSASGAAALCPKLGYLMSKQNSVKTADLEHMSTSLLPEARPNCFHLLIILPSACSL